MSNTLIHIFYTGGTIGMIRNPEGQLVLDPDFVNKLRNSYLHGVPNLPPWDISIRNPTLDSSNMSPQDWLSIATYISVTEAANPGKYTGYVILHGTDTMAYTASALTFMISGLTKPVIFTGSQIPMSAPRNDAVNNVVNALNAAAKYPKPEVCLFFFDKLMLGCRTVKIDSADWNAFDSPNRAPLGNVVDGELVFEKGLTGELEKVAEANLTIQEFTATEVALLRLFPGLSPLIAENVLKDPLKGAVLHAYGAGNGPRNLEDVFTRAAKEENKILIACTQCLRGSVDIGNYETGLGKCGVISGYDMTVEAAVTKLFWLFSKYPGNIESIKRQMQLPLKGELTKP
jgi:L-asparaginase